MNSTTIQDVRVNGVRVALVRNATVGFKPEDEYCLTGGRLAAPHKVVTMSEDKEYQANLNEYAGKERLLAEATRGLLKSMGVTIRRSKGRFNQNKEDAPTVEDYMEEAANAFDEKRSGDAWWCLKAVEGIINQTGEARSYNVRVKQLRRGRHTAPMMVSETTLKGRTWKPIYADREFKTVFFRCENWDREENPCVNGDHFGIRTLSDRHNEVLVCPFGCGGKIQKNIITIDQQLSALRNGR